MDLYYEACSVLKTECDFYDLMYAYLKRASNDNVRVAEIFFDPQTHTERNISFETVINGFHRALVDGYLHFGIKGSLIMCFLRHLTEDAALKTLEQAIPHLDKIIGVGLDSGEMGNPPSKFKRVYKMAHGHGLKLVAHAGEEAGPDYIWEALKELHVSRIDHGVQCLKDEELVKKLVTEQIPLTTCPLSNLKLQVNSRYFQGKNVEKVLLDKGLMVTINSDDPAYFGGYINDNFLHTAAETGMTEKDIYQICRNSFMATFLPLTEKQFYITKLQQFNIMAGYSVPTRSITTFGSRSPKPGTAQYELAYNTAKLFASKGFQVVSGGYSGIMEAVSHGARDAAGKAVGVLAPAVFVGRNPDGNPHIAMNDKAHVQHGHSLLDRIIRLMEASEYFIVFSGTIGTITELMIIWNIASCRTFNDYPTQKIFFFRDPWEKVLSELSASIGIYPSDRELVTFIDKPEEALEIVERNLQERSKTATL